MAEQRWDRTCHCVTCDKWFHPLGIMSHRAAHRRRGERCKITFTHGDCYVYKFDEVE